MIFNFRQQSLQRKHAKNRTLTKVFGWFFIDLSWVGRIGSMSRQFWNSHVVGFFIGHPSPTKPWNQLRNSQLAAESGYIPQLSCKNLLKQDTVFWGPLQIITSESWTVEPIKAVGFHYYYYYYYYYFESIEMMKFILSPFFFFSFFFLFYFIFNITIYFFWSSRSHKGQEEIILKNYY